MTKYVLFIIICIAGFVFSSGTVFAEKQYTVQPGDNLFQIAQNYQVDINALVAANASIKNPNFIEPGQIVKIPDENGVPFTVTAYTAGYESTGKRPDDPGYSITASGTTVQKGRTIACPQSLPFGTKIHFIKWDKTYTCEDRGSAITNGHLDIYIENLKDALEFGVKTLQVKIWTY